MGDVGDLFWPFGDLFGGGETKTVTQPAPTGILSPEQEELLKKLLGIASEGLDKAPQRMPFSTTIPLTEGEKAYASDVNAMRNLGTEQGPGVGYLGALNKVLLGEPTYNTDPQAVLQMWEKEVRPLREQELYGEGGAIPLYKESLVGSGFRSSDTMRGLEKAYLDAGQQMGAEKFKYYQDEVNAGRAAKEAAASRQAALAGESAKFVQEGMKTVGQMERSVEEAKVMEQMQRWLGGETIKGVRNQYANPAMALAMKLMFPTQAVGTLSNTESTGPGQGGQIVSSALSAAGAAAAAAAA